MKRLVLCTIALAASLLIVPHSASAEWTEAVSEAEAKTASVKVVGTEGIRFEVDGIAGVTPDIVNLENVNAFVTVKATSSSGEVWSKKVEVKPDTQTVITLNWVDAAAPAPTDTGKAVAYIGRVFNGLEQCAAEKRYHTKYAFMLDGAEVAEMQLAPGEQKVNVELASGTYSVRVFMYHGDQWIHVETTELAVGADGWQYKYATCPK